MSAKGLLLESGFVCVVAVWTAEKSCVDENGHDKGWKAPLTLNSG